MKVIGAIIIAFSLILGIPFALVGFTFRFIKASFNTGEGLATLLSNWLDSLKA